MTKKHLTLALAAMLCWGLSSCSKNPSEYIIGKWQRTALYWAYSGSPNVSQNYSNGGSMNELTGASNRKIIFSEDKTGMIIDKWVASPNENGIDTMRFTYYIDGNGGVITPVANGQKTTWTTTYTIQDIKKKSMCVYEKTVAAEVNEVCDTPNVKQGRDDNGPDVLFE